MTKLHQLIKQYGNPDALIDHFEQVVNVVARIQWNHLGPLIVEG